MILHFWTNNPWRREVDWSHDNLYVKSGNKLENKPYTAVILEKDVTYNFYKKLLHTDSELVRKLTYLTHKDVTLVNPKKFQLEVSS